MPRSTRSASTSLYVKNVPDRIRGDELRNLFSKYGQVSDVYIPLDFYTRRPRGFAYVQFMHARDADDAMRYLDGAHFNGRELEVEFARGDRKTPLQMRSKERSENGASRSYSRDRSYSRSPSRSRGYRSRSCSRDRGRRSRSCDRWSRLRDKRSCSRDRGSRSRDSDSLRRPRSSSQNRYNRQRPGSRHKTSDRRSGSP